MRLDRRDDGGAVAILVAVLATALFGFAAIVVDLGYARTVNSDAQSTVDAASLAGAGILSEDSTAVSAAVIAIRNSAADNFGTTDADWLACSATPPTPKWKPGPSGPDCILFNNKANDPSKLQVVLPSRHVDSFFGGLFGYGGMDVSARAQATIREEDVPGCALCVQGLLDTSGAVSVGPFSPDLPDGSSSAGSGRVGTGGSITVQPDGAITFAATPNPAKGPVYSPRPIIRPVTDPFSGEPMPQLFPDPALVPASANNVTCGLGPGDVPSLAPGVYRNINVTGPCTATGIIVVTGPFPGRGLRIRSGGSLTATSAVVQLSCGTRTAPTACTTPRSGGRLQIDAGGRISISAMLLTDFSVVADPNNTSPMIINGDLSVDRAIYGRSTAVTLGANATLSTSGPVSVNQMTVGADAAVSVIAPGEAAIPGPPFVGLFQ